MEEVKPKKSRIQVIAEDLGYDCRSYSGRCMYGKTCLGITTSEGIADLVASIIMGACNDYRDDVEVISRIAGSLAKARSDSMGLDTIVYWPSIPFVDSEDEEDEDEDEENSD